MSNQRQTFRKIGITNNVSSTSQPAINLLANASLASSYNLTLPSTVPTVAGQSLISDTAGNLSWGSSSSTVSTFTGTSNPLTTATNVTGLLFTAASSQTTVYVAINATTSIYSLYNVRVYQKGSTTNWGIAYDVSCDTDDVDPQIIFTVTSTGQIQYTFPTTLPGFISLVMMWTLGTSVSNTLTSLALSSTLNVAGPSTFTAGIQGTSLNLSSTFNVTGLATHVAMTGLSLALGNAASLGSVSSTVGTFFSLQNQTYTDSATAASSTAAGTFSASYLGIPTLAATNTAVTNTIASTLTIAGPPIAGSNTTLTNTYAFNVLTGNARFNTGYIIQSLNAWFAIQYIWIGTQTIAGDVSVIGTGNWSTAYAYNGASMITLTSTATQLNFPIRGIYTLTFRVRMAQISLNSSGAIVSPYFVMQTYLGVAYTGLNVVNRLAEYDVFTGGTGTSNSAGDITLNYTGLFYGGDSLLLYMFGTTSNTQQMQPNMGIRLTHTLIQPLL